MVWSSRLESLSDIGGDTEGVDVEKWSEKAKVMKEKDWYLEEQVFYLYWLRIRLVIVMEVHGKRKTIV